MNLNSIFEYAVQQEASDVHLVVGVRPTIRVAGTLTYAGDAPVRDEDIRSVVKMIMTKEQYDRLEETRELDASYEAKTGDRFRVNIYFERGHLGLAARVISRSIPTVDDIGLPAVVTHLLQLQQGLILITGPTGCGKSTTLAAMVENINQNQSRNIITLEDPIEFLFESKNSIVTQRQLGTDMRSFAGALKHVVRQDPDVIMVGEMRDLETMAATVTLAETGHLVLATLHTYSAAQTVDRIIDSFPPYQQSQIRMQLSSVLSAVISQRLVSRISGGRVAAREIMVNTPAVANIIREGKIAQLNTVLETNGKEGMITMDKALQELETTGLITPAEREVYMVQPWLS